MRASIAVASCMGVGLVLQGCGGEEKPSSSCLADKMDVVSQTMSGKLDVTTDVTYNGTKVSNSTQATFTAMLDFEKFNMREEISGETPDGEKVTETVIINVENKQVIAYMDAGKAGKRCVIQELPEGGKDAVTQLALTFSQLVKPAISKAAVCGGNDGTYDTWKFNISGDVPMPAGGLPPIPDLPVPLPSLDGLSIKDGSVSEDLQMSKDQLLHSSTTHVSGELLNDTETIGSLKMMASVTIDKATPGGPSPDDLDPSKFGVKCEKVNATDIIPGFAHQQFLRFIEAAKNSEHALMV